MDAQLPAQAAYVRANSRIADAQPARDRAGGLSRGDQAQHLPLAHGQALQLAGDRLLFVQQSCDRPRRDQVPPTCDGANRLHHFRRGARFMDERAGSGLDSGDASGVAVVPRQEDELRFRTDLAKPGTRFSPSAGGPAEVSAAETNARIPLTSENCTLLKSMCRSLAPSICVERERATASALKRSTTPEKLRPLGGTVCRMTSCLSSYKGSPSIHPAMGRSPSAAPLIELNPAPLGGRPLRSVCPRPSSIPRQPRPVSRPYGPSGRPHRSTYPVKIYATAMQCSERASFE